MCADGIGGHDHKGVCFRFYAQSGGELPPGETMPKTASGIRKRLRELGNRRADYY